MGMVDVPMIVSKGKTCLTEEGLLLIGVNNKNVKKK